MPERKGRSKQINIEICRIFCDFYLADSMNNEKYSGHDVHRDVHFSLAKLCMEVSVRWR